MFINQIFMYIIFFKQLSIDDTFNTKLVFKIYIQVHYFLNCTLIKE
jgi:hypothetical protein